MNAKALVVQGTDEIQLYACGKCGLCYHAQKGDVERSLREATECCDPRCIKCGAATKSRGWLHCEPCRAIVDAEREAARFAKAKKFTEAEYSGPVYWSGGDRYFSDTDDFREHMDDDPERVMPEYVYACTTRHFALDVDDMIETTGEQLELEEFDPHTLYEVPALRAFVKEWNAKQNLEAWYVNHSEAVVLDA